MSSEAYGTLATNYRDALGALVLTQSIRETETTRNLVVLVSKYVPDITRLDSISFLIDLTIVFV